MDSFPRFRGGSAASPEGMTIDDLAAYVQLSRSSLYKLVQCGRVPGKKIGRHWRFRKDIIDHWIATGTTAKMAAQQPNRSTPL